MKTDLFVLIVGLWRAWASVQTYKELGGQRMTSDHPDTTMTEYQMYKIFFVIGILMASAGLFGLIELFTDYLKQIIA